MFQRQDLLVLTSDDLMILSNRGLVKRAIKELESGHSYDLKVDEVGTIIVHWSDAIECILPTNVTLNQSYCSCAATTLCRHILKSVLAYQQTVHAQSSPQTVAGLSEPPSPNPDPLSPPEFSTWTTWNPGEISDTELAKYYRKPDLNRLQKSFNSGQVMELIQHQKPLAQFHSLPYTLRFLVPHDIRYTHCNCAEPAPCSHVPLAIWGFRLLPPGQTSGLVETATAALAIPVNLLDELERAVSDLVQTGLANCSTTLIGRFNRLISQCRAEGLVWPAEILGELLGERDRYLAHDARFSPIRVAELIGELCIRLDGIRANTGAIPQLLIRGSKADRVTEIGSARLIGLGCGIQIQYRHFKLSAYLQDADSGTLVNLGRDFSQGHSEADSPQPFAVLARTPVKRGIAWGDLGAGQLLTQGGKLTPSHELILGRAKATLNPQAYHWENLRSPLGIEDFAELQAHLQTLPPACLRSRRITDSFQVCRVAAVDSVEFNPVDHAVVAMLRDHQGQGLRLSHPYTFRGQAGAEVLLTQLQTLAPDQIKFVAGQVFLKAQGLVIYPVSLVIQRGHSRTLLQPWVDQTGLQIPNQTADPTTTPENSDIQPLAADAPPVPSNSPLASLLTASLEQLAELMMIGLQRGNPIMLQGWQEIEQWGQQIGFYRFVQPLARLMQQLEQKQHSLDWSADAATQTVLEIAVWLHLAQNLAIA